MMIEQNSFKRLIIQEVIHHASPMAIRQVSVSDQMDLPEFNGIFCDTREQRPHLRPCRFAASHLRYEPYALMSTSTHQREGVSGVTDIPTAQLRGTAVGTESARGHGEGTQDRYCETP